MASRVPRPIVVRIALALFLVGVHGERIASRPHATAVDVSAHRRVGPRALLTAALAGAAWAAALDQLR